MLAVSACRQSGRRASRGERLWAAPIVAARPPSDNLTSLEAGRALRHFTSERAICQVSLGCFDTIRMSNTNGNTIPPASLDQMRPKRSRPSSNALFDRKVSTISGTCRIRSVEASAKGNVGRRGDGAQRRIRTTDTRIFSPLLYQLSYLGLRRLTGCARRVSRGHQAAPLESAWVIARESWLSSA